MFLDIDQRLDRRLDLDFDEAELAPTLDQAVDGRMRDAELICDLRLRQTFQKVKHEGLVHLPCDDDLFARADADFGLAFGISGGLPLVQQMIDRNGGQQYAALNHILPVDGDVEQDQRARHHR